MSSRRLAVFLLGFWLGCSLFMVWVASHNLTSVDTVLKQNDRQLQREIKDIGYDRVRTLLRFEAAELNRHYFYYWEWTQILVAILGGLILFYATGGNRLTGVIMASILIVLLVQHFLVAPSVVELGRGFDFAPADQMTDERRAFSTYHTYYSSLELIKLLLLIVVCVRMLLHGSSGKKRHRSGRSTLPGSDRQLDMINKTDHSHIDR